LDEKFHNGPLARLRRADVAEGTVTFLFVSLAAQASKAFDPEQQAGNALVSDVYRPVRFRLRVLQATAVLGLTETMAPAGDRRSGPRASS